MHGQDIFACEQGINTVDIESIRRLPSCFNLRDRWLREKNF